MPASQARRSGWKAGTLPAMIRRAEREAALAAEQPARRQEVPSRRCWGESQRRRWPGSTSPSGSGSGCSEWSSCSGTGDTVDKLGVGVVRDALADLLVPATSTLHSRSRYLLFVPWIYQTIERSSSCRRDSWRHVRRSDIQLIGELLDSDDSEGTLGPRARATPEPRSAWSASPSPLRGC